MSNEDQIFRTLGRLEAGMDELLRLNKDTKTWQGEHETLDNARFSALTEKVNLGKGILMAVGAGATFVGWIIPQIIQWLRK